MRWPRAISRIGIDGVTAARAGASAQGKITYRPEVDPTTSTVEVVAVVPNPTAVRASTCRRSIAPGPRTAIVVLDRVQASRAGVFAALAARRCAAPSRSRRSPTRRADRSGIAIDGTTPGSIA